MSPESSFVNHPRRAALAAVVKTLALTAADERRSRVGDGLDELVKEHRLGDSDGRVGEVDVLALLRRVDSGERPSVEERVVLARLLAQGIADGIEEREQDADSAARAERPQSLDAMAASLCWLSANTFLNALPELDAVLEPDAAEALWQAIFRRVQSLDEEVARRGRAEALAGLAGLVGSPSTAAASALRVLADELTDGALKAFAELAAHQVELAAEQDDEPTEDDEEGIATKPRQRRSSLHVRRVVLSGELVAYPLGPFGIVLGAVTGALVVRGFVRFGGRLLLKTRRPAELRVDGTGLTVSSRTEVLGRTVKTEETALPFANLAVFSREVRFPRLGLYAGLLALAAGTFLGTSLLGDGVLSRSPSMLALGAAVFGAGVAFDMLLSSVGASAGGRHRLLIVPRRGRKLAMLVPDARAADEALRAVSERTG